MSQPATKKRKTGANAAGDGPKITDSRFVNIQSDPRYRLPGKKQKIRVDKRFARALEDAEFTRRAKVDRYGRPLETNSERKRLKRKYEFEEEEDDSGPESDEADDDDEVQSELRRIDDARDILREGRDMSSSDSESTSDEETDEQEAEEELVDEVGPGIRDGDVPMGDVSSRLAVVNLDWDNIRAEDLMAVFQSFLPSTGRLLKVSIYPSEFGKERIDREEMEGPPKEIFAKNHDSLSEEEAGEDDEDIKESIIKPDDGSEFDSSALRQYQLERLRYYYAVLTFSDSRTAKSIYDAVDGTEYLSTANFFDLRFVPDETDFSEDTPREECERISSGYKPNEFVTDALQHSKVKLTWDADDTTRKEAQARAFRRGRREIDEDDLKTYLGSDSESSDGEDETTNTNGLSKKETERQRMRALLGLAPEPVKKASKDKKDVPLGNIQITFSSGLTGPAEELDESSDGDGSKRKPRSKRSVFENSPEPDETTVEKYVRKERERKQRRKEKMKNDRAGDTTAVAINEDDPEQQSDQEQLGFEDPFFAEPTHDAKSANRQRKAERLQRRAEREAEEAANAKQRAQLELLMADDDDDNDTPGNGKKGRSVKHFDMNEIEKAEKAMAKKNKRSKRNKDGAVAAEAVLAADDFKIDTEDPRFANLFDDHEFAIDPSNPRFKGTRGMKALLEEGRRRKGNDDGKLERNMQTSKVKVPNGLEMRDSEVRGLVEKVKRRNRQ